MNDQPVDALFVSTEVTDAELDELIDEFLEGMEADGAAPWQASDVGRPAHDAGAIADSDM